MAEEFTGGQSRPGGPVLVTPSGEAVSSTTVRVSGGGGSSRRIEEEQKKQEKFQSELLKQSFPSVEARKQAEQQFKEQRQQQQLQKQLTSASAVFGGISPAERQRQLNTISPAPQAQGFFPGISQRIGTQIGRLELRGITSDSPIQRQLAGAGAFGLGAARIPVDILGFGETLVRSPGRTVSAISDIRPRDIQRQISSDIQTRPSAFFGGLAAEIPTGLATGRVISTTGRASRLGVDALTGRLRRVRQLDGKEVIPNVPSISPERRALDIELAGGAASTAESIPEQLTLAGTRQDLVSAQRDLFGLFKRERTIDKPKPTPDASELERSMFFDPRGRLRTSRLGLDQKEAGILDILSGDVTFRRKKPQVILLEDFPIERLPSELSDVKRKLQTGRSLTPEETQRLERFQMRQSGQAKPIGFESVESEVTLPPGEILQKRGTPAVTVIQGQRVPIIRAGLKEASEETRNLLRKIDEGTITQPEIERLRRNIRREGGISSDLAPSQPFISRGRLAGQAISGVSGLPSQRQSISPFLTGRSSILSGTTSRQSGFPASPSTTAGVPLSPISPTPTSPNILSPPTTPTGTSPPVRPTPTTRPPVRPTPTARPPIIPSQTPRPPSKEQTLNGMINDFKRRETNFDVFVGQGKKEKKIADDLPIGKALKKGTEFTSRTLRATFTLRPDFSATQRKADINFRPPGESFRRSRAKAAPPLRFVERKNKRLNTGKEVSDILKSKKRKK